LNPPEFSFSKDRSPVKEIFRWTPGPGKYENTAVQVLSGHETKHNWSFSKDETKRMRDSYWSTRVPTPGVGRYELRDKVGKGPKWSVPKDTTRHVIEKDIMKPGPGTYDIWSSIADVPAYSRVATATS
jgi:hypothetical protein